MFPLGTKHLSPLCQCRIINKHPRSALISQVSGLSSLALVLIPAAGTYRFTDCLQMKGFQFLGHFLMPLTVPAIKVGRLEETPAESEVTLRRGTRRDPEKYAGSRFPFLLQQTQMLEEKTFPYTASLRMATNYELFQPFPISCFLPSGINTIQLSSFSRLSPVRDNPASLKLSFASAQA